MFRAALLCAILLLATARAEASADLILTGGAIYTLDARRPWAQAVVVAKGRIAYIGGDTGALAYRGPRTRVIALHGRMVLPGFHDGHAHPVTGAMRLLQCRLDDIEPPAKIADAIRACATTKPPGTWLLGNGLSPQAFAPGGVAHTALDAILSDRPAVLRTPDGYTAWVNSKALALAGIDPRGTGPAIDGVERDAATGRPTGVLRNDAVDLVRRQAPAPTQAEYREALRRSTAIANSFGITAIFDASVTEPVLDAYHAADLAGEMTVRVVAAQRIDPARGPEQVDEFVARRDRVRGALFRADAAKIFLDGEFENHTAALLAPYADAPTERGALFVEPEKLDAIVRRLDDEGFLIHLHAMGDGAVRAGLDALALAMKANGPRDRRHQIAHLGVVDPADIPRFGGLGVTANIQPLWFQADDPATASTDLALGPARTRWNYPVAGIAAAGGRIVAGSDWPGPTMNPLDGIQYAMTRRPLDGGKPPRQPQERVSLAAMLAAYTRNAAWAVREDAVDGTLTAGKAADLIVLDRNLFKIAVRDIHTARVLLTLLDGKPVYRDPSWR